MAAIIGGTALLLGTLKQTVYSCERLMGYRDNGLKPLQWEYERFPNAPAMAIRGLKVNARSGCVLQHSLGLL